jgi:alkylhydroperoxidase family enzyme
MTGKTRYPTRSGTAARHYSEKALGSLVIQIALINAFNRLNVATRQPAGAWAKSA